MNWYSKTSELANVRTPDLILHAQVQTPDLNYDRACALLPQETLGGRGARGSAAFAGASWTSSRGASSGQESLGASCAPAGRRGAAMLYCITMDAANKNQMPLEDKNTNCY